MDWNNLWAKVKDYIGIGLNTVKDATKNIEVTPPSAPDLHEVASKNVTKTTKTARKSKKKT